jgi:hypothetical protein
MTDNGAAALASILHDIYGCRITCRGGRLADDRHPSHAEAYLDTARAVLDALDGVGWRLTARDKASPNEATIATLRAELDGWLQVIDLAGDQMLKMEGEIATLRAALDGLRRLAKSGTALSHLNESGVMVRHNGTLWECEAERCIAARELAWTPEERAAKIAALATAKETP